MSNKKGIWVVDDDAIAVAIVSHLIESQKEMELLNTFSNATEVMEALDKSEKRPDLIILDLNMPMMSGWDMLEEMKAKDSLNAIKVAIFSSSIDQRDKKKSVDYSCIIGYFVKPMTKSTLNRIAENL